MKVCQDLAPYVVIWSAATVAVIATISSVVFAILSWRSRRKALRLLEGLR